ncbi:MAG: hypothetical protein C6I01_03165 [Epsilonproteobacteria bacterium]|nr:hypothetical protein [Campylobacterota bacterium]
MGRGRGKKIGKEREWGEWGKSDKRKNWGHWKKGKNKTAIERGGGLGESLETDLNPVKLKRRGRK